MVAYVRSVFLQPNHAVFDARALQLEDFALSMGMATVPRLRFLARPPVPASQPPPNQSAALPQVSMKHRLPVVRLNVLC